MPTPPKSLVNQFDDGSSPPPGNRVTLCEDREITQRPEDFERILLDSSYVKRVGLGFQSNVSGPVGTCGPIRKRKSALFFNTLIRPKSVHPQDPPSNSEFGILDAPDIPPASESESTPSMNLVRRAVRVVLGNRIPSTKKSRTF